MEHVGAIVGTLLPTDKCGVRGPGSPISSAIHSPCSLEEVASEQVSFFVNCLQIVPPALPGTWVIVRTKSIIP